MREIKKAVEVCDSSLAELAAIWVRADDIATIEADATRVIRRALQDDEDKPFVRQLIRILEDRQLRKRRQAQNPKVLPSQ